MKLILVAAFVFGFSTGAFAQPGVIPGSQPGTGIPPAGVPGIGAPGIPVLPPSKPIKLIHKPKAMTTYRLEFKVADQMFFVNTIGGKFILNVAHNAPNGERTFTVQGEFLPGGGTAAGMLDFESTLTESNLDEGVDGNYTCKGSTTIKNGQSQQLATLGHHVLSLTVGEVK